MIILRYRNIFARSFRCVEVVAKKMDNICKRLKYISRSRNIFASVKGVQPSCGGLGKGISARPNLSLDRSRWVWRSKRFFRANGIYLRMNVNPHPVRRFVVYARLNFIFGL